MILELNELTKKYKDKVALDNVNFSFTPGIYGLLGPNGAGKSTMMNRYRVYICILRALINLP